MSYSQIFWDKFMVSKIDYREIDWVVSKGINEEGFQWFEKIKGDL